MYRTIIGLATGLVCLSTVVVLAAAQAALGVPKDYRSWAHAKSMVIPDKNHGLYGFHHIYVSPKALKTYRAGSGSYPEGSEIVVPFYEVAEDGGMIMQGPLRMVAVMRKDKKAKDTGGWQWGAFDPAGKVLDLDVKTGCYDCHTAKKDRDFVFSEWQ